MKLLKLSVVILTVAFMNWGCISPDLRSARIAMNEKDWDRAKVNLEKELNINPNNAEALYRMGLCFENYQDWATMSEYYDKSLAVSPQFESQIERSRLILVSRFMKDVETLDKAGKTDEALANINTAIVINPHEIILHQNGAIIAFNGEMYNEAINYAMNAIKIEETLMAKGETEGLPDIYVRQVLLEANNMLGEEEEAMKWAQDLMSLIDPKVERETYLRALDEVLSAYEKVKNYEKGIQFVTEAIELFPEIIELRKNLAVLYNGIDNNEKVKEIYIEILEITPDDFDVCRWLGYILLNEKNYVEAIPILEKAHSLNPKTKDVIQYLMKAYFETEQEDKAQEMVTKLKALSEE